MVESTIPTLDFEDTAVAFAAKSDAQLRKATWIFGLMKNSTLVSWGSRLTLLGLNLRLPVQPIIKATIFEHFCGGTTLLETQKTVDKLAEFGVQTILDYGAEGKETEEDFNRSMNETLRAIHFANNNTSVPIVSVKVTGIARFALLEKVQKGNRLADEEAQEWENVMKRLDSICHLAAEKGIGVFVDAEETWVQDSIDYLVQKMMARYNRSKAVVYNTFQLYRHDRLQFLKDSFALAKREGFILGAKLVRGAYMDKERQRAAEMGYPSPIQPDRAATNRDFNAAVRFCVENYDRIAACTASHNAESCKLQVQLITELNLPKNHPHFLFSQLYGMSDHLTFNLRKAGFNASKYVPYGPVRDVIPYLIRRAEENTSVTGDIGRELSLFQKEMKRRGL